MDRRIRLLSIFVAVIGFALYTCILFRKQNALPAPSMDESLIVGDYKFVSKTANGEYLKTEFGNRYDTLFAQNVSYLSDGFDYPVGKPEGKGYYDAQPFMRNTHLGCDWNGVKGGNSDLGDPVYSIANGYVTYADDVGGGWGNIVRVVHCIKGQPNRYVESLYAHLDTITVANNTWLKRGTKIGTIGTAHGAYVAHLHFELRHKVDMNIGPGYSTDTTGYLNPTAFIKKHRLVK